MINQDNLALERIGNVVGHDYRTADAFKKHGLDFCCGGGKTIQQACADNNVDTDSLIQDLVDAMKSSGPHMDHTAMSASELVDYILDAHHDYVSENVLLIQQYADKVAAVHGQANPEVVQVRNVFKELGQELMFHMVKEEQVLFPYIKRMERCAEKRTTAPPPPFGSVSNPIHAMEHEHEGAGQLMARLAELTSDFTPPPHACQTYKVLYAKLREFTDDLKMHVHLENNVLFAKAIALEESMVT